MRLEYISQLIKIDLDDIANKTENPEKTLEKAVNEIQDCLSLLYQAMDKATATYNRTEQQYIKNQSEVSVWHQRAEFALQKRDKDLAREALVRKNSIEKTASDLKILLDRQANHLNIFSLNITALEDKLAKAREKRDLLKARRLAAEASKQLNSVQETSYIDDILEKFAKAEEIEDLSSNAQQVESFPSLENRLRKVEQRLEAMQSELQHLLADNSCALGEVRELLKESRSRSETKPGMFSNHQVFGMKKTEKLEI